MRRAALFWMLYGVCVSGAVAQELTPRAYWPAPDGTRIVALGYAFSEGDVLTDPSLPIYGVDSRINNGVLAYVHVFNLWGRTSSFLAELPYSQGTTEAVFEENPVRRDFAGFGDMGFTLTVNLLGAPTMDAKGFQQLRAAPHPILGASVKVLAPTGKYDRDRFINVGSNRWAVKPELACIVPLTRKWLVEFEVGAWFFGDDNDFLAGKREQGPILATAVHLVRRFTAGFWASLDATYYGGGEQTIGGEPLQDIQRNGRVGGTIVVPFRGRQAVKVGFSAGFTTESGTDFNQVLASYSFVF